MIPLVLLLIQASGTGAPSASGQERSPRVVQVGDRVEGVLPVRLDGDRNVSEEIFELDTGTPGSVTLTLESLDFDALLVVRDEGHGTEKRDGRSWRYSNAWIVHDVEAPTKLAVHVASEDDRGGEFALSVRSGRVDAPRGIEQVREAIAYCEAVAERAGKSDEAPRAAKFLGTASQAAYRIQDFRSAKALAERQLEKALAANLDEESLRAEVNLGSAERSLGEGDHARQLLEGALERIERRLAATEDPGLAALAIFVTDNLGELAREKGGHALAIPFYRKALEFMPRANRPGFEPIGWCKLGDALSEIGEIKEAKAAIEKGLALAEALGQPYVLAVSLLYQARYLQKRGAPAEARARCERGVALSPPPGTLLELQATLSNALIELGRYEQASTVLVEVESLAKQLAQDRYEIPLRISRARIAYDLWDLHHARVLLEEALAMQEASGSPLHQVEILMKLGAVHLDQDRSDETEKRYTEALETCEKTGEREMQARVLVEIGLLHEKAGNLEVAATRYAEAETIGHQAGSISAEDLARCGRAYVLFLQGCHSEARDLALGVAERCEASGELRVAEAAHDTLARVALATGDLESAEDALRAVDRILEQQSAPVLDRFASARLRSRFADWGAIAQDLVARRSSAADLPEPERDVLVRDGWRKAGEWKARILLEGLQARAPAVEAIPGAEAESWPGHASFTLPQIGNRTVVVEYVAGLENLFAYVATQQSVRLVDLGEREPIEERARTFVRAISELGTLPSAISSQGVWLYEHLFSPLSTWLPSGVATIVIVPTPALAVLPFDALVHPRPASSGKVVGFGNLHYLGDDFTIVYAPSSPVLAELQRRGPRGGDSRFLVLGDPLYLHEESDLAVQDEKIAQARPGSSGFDYSRLKSTREESLEIARLMILRDATASPDQHAQLLQAGSQSQRSTELRTALFDVYLGSRARRESLSGDLRAYSCLHIAAHGHVDPEDPRRSGLLLSYEPQSMGLFSVEDVLGLSLDADMTVLSACDTARGPIVRGEGVLSLAYAFLRAGSRSVVATLWKVDDHDASRIMRSFYAGHLEQRLHPAEALRRAKREFRRSPDARGVSPGTEGSAPTATAANPYYWAPFVYVGAGPE